MPSFPLSSELRLIGESVNSEWPKPPALMEPRVGGPKARRDVLGHEIYPDDTKAVGFIASSFPGVLVVTVPDLGNERSGAFFEIVFDLQDFRPLMKASPMGFPYHVT